MGMASIAGGLFGILPWFDRGGSGDKKPLGAKEKFARSCFDLALVGGVTACFKLVTCNVCATQSMGQKA